MPIIRKQESSKRPGAAEGAESSILVGVDQGSRSLHIEEVSVAPNARIPRRINPHTEVAIIVQEGKLDAILGRDRVPIGPGDTVLARQTGTWAAMPALRPLLGATEFGITPVRCIQLAPPLISRGTESSQTRRWSKGDSN